MPKHLVLQRDKNYKSFLYEIKDRLRSAQIKAVLAVNRELIKFYWQLGKELIAKQQAFNWGDKFLEQFSQDMRKEFPDMQGFSLANLRRMKNFVLEYPDFLIRAQAVRELPWGHLVVLIHRVKEKKKRQWYIQQTVKNGWSRSTLEIQIEGNLYARQASPNKKITNYKKTLPAAQSDLATGLLKDPYDFDFLTIHGKANERAIENALTVHIRNFLLELGQGFSFVGSQVPLTFDDQEFFIDLLFYHLHLHCYVVIELKAGKFKPEHTGQLGFYMAAVDNQLRHKGDKKTIGILLCKSKNKIVAEYALQNMKAPIGVSEYNLMKTMPKELKVNLPSIKELEIELNKAVKKT